MRLWCSVNALAIQVATIATLAPKNLETKTTSFGDYEVSIAVRARQSYRLILFALAVTPSVYIFEQSIRSFGPSQIGEGQGDGFRTLCFGGLAFVTDYEDYVLSAFLMAASLFVLVFIAGFGLKGSVGYGL
ncbi:hypothetical protein B0T16DRAFT_389379 [Cercophora newfieldiana]|uniref:Uncharacterized protein n=1 Tax=Cercophora newfieldiana TaxID=92897 RepID=A0AA39YE34_9PEZI|nr:hypothetical protein B0T16DRAFT_389379 [Cercophora newfieldiana]